MLLYALDVCSCECVYCASAQCSDIAAAYVAAADTTTAAPAAIVGVNAIASM
jgi:rhodanese-related sulfurtransferase